MLMHPNRGSTQVDQVERVRAACRLVDEDDVGDDEGGQAEGDQTQGKPRGGRMRQCEHGEHQQEQVQRRVGDADHAGQRLACACRLDDGAQRNSPDHEACRQPRHDRVEHSAQPLTVVIGRVQEEGEAGQRREEQEGGVGRRGVGVGSGGVEVDPFHLSRRPRRAPGRQRTPRPAIAVSRPGRPPRRTPRRQRRGGQVGPVGQSGPMRNQRLGKSQHQGVERHDDRDRHDEDAPRRDHSGHGVRLRRARPMEQLC